MPEQFPLTPSTSSSGLWAEQYAAQAGFVLVPIERGAKGPRGRAWHLREHCVVDPNWHGNIGLVHVHSGTCAVDIDFLDEARAWLSGVGVDLDALLTAPDAVQIVSGVPGHAKLLYRLPFPRVSAKHVMMVGGSRQDVINFRCATRDLGAGVQDVLPPSLHPGTGEPYAWGGAGDWRRLPMLPADLGRAWDVLLAPRAARGTVRAVDREAVGRSDAWPADRGRAVGALETLDPDMDRSEWVRIGMAFQAAGGEWVDWDAWSGRGDKYAGPEDTAAVWRSFEVDVGGGVGAGTLYHRAMEEGGWVPPERTVEGMFGGDVPEAPAVGVGGTGGGVGGMSAAALTDPTLLEDIEEVSPSTPTDVALELARRVARMGSDEDDAKRWLKKLSKKLGSEIPVGTLRKAYQAEKRAQGPVRARVATPGGEGVTGRLERAMATLAVGVASEPVDFPSLAGRYVWVQSEAAFVDRLTRGSVTPFTLNCSYAHLKWDLTKNGAAVGAAGGYAGEGGEDGGDAPPKPADVLLDSGACVKVETMDYWPGVREPVFADRGMLTLNTWVDDGVKPVKGDVGPWLKHLEWLVPDDFENGYIKKYWAFSLRYQNLKINHNILMGGAARIGKDTAAVPWLAGFGLSNTSTIEGVTLEEPYQDGFVHKKVVVLNEVHQEGKLPRVIENRLKPMGAAPPGRITLRRFNNPSIEQRNIVQIFAMSNYPTAMSLETSAERWFCVWCAPEEKKPTQYYVDLYAWMNNGGISAVIHYLLNEVDLSDFEPTADAPNTPWREALVDLATHATPVSGSIREMIDSGEPPFNVDLVRRSDVVDKLLGMPSMAHVKVTPTWVSRALAESGCVSSLKKTYWNEKDQRNKTVGLWAVRNMEHWKNAPGFEWQKCWVENKKYFDESEVASERKPLENK